MIDDLWLMSFPKLEFFKTNDLFSRRILVALNRCSILGPEVLIPFDNFPLLNNITRSVINLFQLLISAFALLDLALRLACVLSVHRGIGVRLQLRDCRGGATF